MPSQYNYRYIQFKRWTQNWGKERVSPFAPHQHDCWQLHSFIEEISLWFPRHARQPDPVLARDKMETHSHETVLLCNVLVQIGAAFVCRLIKRADLGAPPPPANETNPEVASLVSLPWWKMLEDVYVDSLEDKAPHWSVLIFMVFFSRPTQVVNASERRVAWFQDRYIAADEAGIQTIPVNQIKSV